MEVARYAREGRDVVLIGHAGHPEVEGTMGRFDTRNGGHMHLIENVEQARRLEVRDPEPGSRSSRRPRCRSMTPRPSSNTLRERFPIAGQPAA